jgi:hypothetical protein
MASYAPIGWKLGDASDSRPSTTTPLTTAKQPRHHHRATTAFHDDV